MSPHELHTLIEGGRAPVIVDVRTRREFVAGHVPGARHIPFWRPALPGFTLDVASEVNVVLYCGHGPRAWVAAVVLWLRGRRRMAFVEGHWAAWTRNALGTEPPQSQ